MYVFNCHGSRMKIPIYLLEPYFDNFDALKLILATYENKQLCSPDESHKQKKTFS